MSSWGIAAWLMLGGSTVLLFIGMPVALTFITINLIGAWLYMGGEPGLMQLARSSVSSVTAFSLTPIPLFVLMGRGCETVSRVHTADTDFVTGVWKDGRIGTVYAARPDADYGAVIFRGKEVIDLHPKKGAASEYRPLLLEILKFFQSGQPPVPNEDILEIMAFMDAAQRSKQQGGAPVPLL